MDVAKSEVVGGGLAILRETRCSHVPPHLAESLSGSVWVAVPQAPQEASQMAPCLAPPEVPHERQQAAYPVAAGRPHPLQHRLTSESGCGAVARGDGKAQQRSAEMSRLISRRDCDFARSHCGAAEVHRGVVSQGIDGPSTGFRTAGDALRIRLFSCRSESDCLFNSAIAPPAHALASATSVRMEDERFGLCSRSSSVLACRRWPSS
jgi:hypothetical protein